MLVRFLLQEQEWQKGGDVITLVAVKEGCEQYEAATKLIDWYHLNGNEKPSKTGQKREEVAIVNSPKSDCQPLEEAIVNNPLAFAGFKDLDTTHEYLRNRGVRITTAEEFGVGYFAGRSSVIKDPYRIVIPIHNRHGQLVAYAGRSLDPQAADKYHFPAGFHKSLELFNLHRVTGQTVVLLEGFFGVMNVHQEGYPNVVALMGRTISAAQLALLERFRNVVLMLDGDSPGREATEDITLKLAPRCFVTSIALKNGEQPDSLGAEQIQNLLRPVFV